MYEILDEIRWSQCSSDIIKWILNLKAEDQPGFVTRIHSLLFMEVSQLM